MSLSNAQIANLWVQEGGRPSAASLAAAVAKAESSGRKNATNHNTNGTVDRGLFQINSIHGALSTHDLRANVRAAIKISNNGRNWSPWVTYNTGAYKKYFNGKASSSSAASRGGLKATTHTTPASTSTDTTGALVDSLLAGGSGKVKGSIHQNILSHAQALVQSGAYTTTTPAKTSVSLHQSSGGSGGAANTSAPSEHAGTTMIDGKPVANWIAAEVRWARAHGWTGRVNSGYRSDAEQVHIWNSGVRPAAKPKSLGGGGSNHSGTNFPYGAIDVSDAQGLARILRNKPGGSRLVWAGAKDPVHLSHPHGGGY